MSGRYVVQHHVIGADSHWDLMFEDGAALATWRSPRPLSEVGRDAVAIERIAPHRLAYLEYEGAVSGNRGEVRVVERGMFEMVKREAGEWVVRVESGGRTRVLRLSEVAGAEWRIEAIE